jgi:hypothetical protein
MIEIIKNILPEEINKKIIHFLLSTKNWKIAHDSNNLNLINDLLGDPGKDYGFSLQTFNEPENINLDSPLNLYGEIIYSIIKKNTKYNFLKPNRFYWNYYNNSSHTLLHTDKESNNFVSFLYNLHTSNGGTEINGTFYKSNCGEAIIFPSNLLHKAITSTDTKSRFSFNCIVELERINK